MEAQINPSEVLGSRLLREVASEEGSLEDLLKDLRAQIPNTQSRTGLPSLDILWKQHGGKLTVSGRGLPLLYQLVNHLIHALNGTVALVDIDGRFSPSHLDLTSDELKHIHVFRPMTENLKATMESLEGYMFYGEHGSKGREWVGTIISGGIAAGGDIMFGWRGWLRVERDLVRGFEEGTSVEEAWDERERRQDVVDLKGWRGLSEIGEFTWV